mgnify:CR=1 FL=1
MKKTPVQLRFDAAKLKALEYYLPQAGTTVEEELQKRFDELYDNEVPMDVKRFLKFQTGEASPEENPAVNSGQDEKSSEGKASKRQKSSPKTESSPSQEISAPVQTM